MAPKYAPGHDPDVWLFDLDNTLYPARCNLFAQIDVRIGRYISDWLKVDAEEARRVQKQYWRDHGTSMRGMMSLHGVDPTHYLDYVHDIDYSPVEANPALESVAARAARPQAHLHRGRRAACRAGDGAAGRGASFRGDLRHRRRRLLAQAAPADLRAAGRKHGIDPTRAAFADDIVVNLKPAHDMGMRTVWIRTDESVKRAADADLDHIHHQTDDLATWLADWLAERNVKK